MSRYFVVCSMDRYTVFLNGAGVRISTAGHAGEEVTNILLSRGCPDHPLADGNVYLLEERNPEGRILAYGDEAWTTS